MTKPISVVMGSQSDLETVQETMNVLKEFKVEFEVRVLSAHRTPKELAEYVETSTRHGTKVFIAAAGGAAALAGVIAAHTVMPVIGIPIETSGLRGMDSLLSTVQMPGGVPVAAMAIGKAGARNAALFALEILAVSDKNIQTELIGFKAKMREKILNTSVDV